MGAEAEEAGAEERGLPSHRAGPLPGERMHVGTCPAASREEVHLRGMAGLEEGSSVHAPRDLDSEHVRDRRADVERAHMRVDDCAVLLAGLLEEEWNEREVREIRGVRGVDR